MNKTTVQLEFDGNGKKNQKKYKIETIPDNARSQKFEIIYQCFITLYYRKTT